MNDFDYEEEISRERAIRNFIVMMLGIVIGALIILILRNV